MSASAADRTLGTAECGSGVCVVGSFMKDLMARVPRLPKRGETLHGVSFGEFLGGKGLNQAVAAVRNGARTAMVGRLGQDAYGAEFLAFLAAEGIDAERVTVDPDNGTGVGLPLVEADGSNAIVIIPRANSAVTAADVEAAADRISAAAVLTVQLELPVESAVKAVQIAEAAGTLTVFNPAPMIGTLPPEIAGAVDILVPNEVEAEQLAGRSSVGDEAVQLARSVAKEYARIGCVLTLGERGAVVVDRSGGTEQVDWIRPHRVDTVDTVGAGDAFCGALAARLAAGDSLAAAAGFANAAAALSTTVDGAVDGIPRAADVLSFLGAAS